MATLGFIEYQDASAEVRAVYDDIMATRKTDWINNFWKALAHDPVTLRRTWESIKEIMAPGALDALTKEMLYWPSAPPTSAATASPRTPRPRAKPA